MRLRLLAVLASTAALITAQSSGQTPSPTPSLSLSLTTGTTTITTSTRRNGQNTPLTTTVPTTFNVTYTVTPTASTSPSPSASESPPPISLDTRVDPAFGVLGAVLILTGIPSAFLGHKNRWTSFFLTGFYTLSLVCFVLILNFGVIPAVNPPTPTLRGMFVLSSVIAGIAGGGIAIFFWKGARYCIGAWGGLALGFWIQCFRDGGVIRPIGFRWLLFIGCAVIGFVLCTIPKLHYHVILISTAMLGASAIMLGVDCYTTAGLKEFYVWNIGFNAFFKTFTSRGIQFPVSQTMQIELGLIGAITLIGSAVQLRILNILQRKMREISDEQKQRDAEMDGHSTAMFASVEREKEQWEKEHGRSHERKGSDYSSMPLMKDLETSPTPSTPDFRPSEPSGRVRLASGISEYMSQPMRDDEARHVTGGRQSPGALPTLDLGIGIEDDVPKNYLAEGKHASRKGLSADELEALRKKEELEAEIQNIRNSIDILRAEPSVATRRPSFSSKRTLSMDAQSALLPVVDHLRPPRATEPRGRVRSMDLNELSKQSSMGSTIGRPTSVPLQDESWDQYVIERKLLQPPAGVTPPISPSVITPTSSRAPMAPAVVAALNDRRARESQLGFGSDSREDVPLSQITPPHARRRGSTGGNIPVTILPPKKSSGNILAPTPQRPSTRTFEELNERHREKLRGMQDPVTAAQKEQADLAAAKERWDRSKALERDAVARRQAEKAALLERRKEGQPGRSSADGMRPKAQHSRSLSADMLATLGSGVSNRKSAALKVEDWQRYQQTTGAAEASGSARRRDSRPLQTEGAPPANGHRSRGPVN